jgi:penicillin amidase
MSTLKRVLAVVLALLILAILGLILYGVILVRSSFPKTDGTVQLPGIVEEVEVFRDSYGIPHIYASNEHDLFLAMGYVHAQDRFWQMDFWRHIGSGRLSEIFGESQLETDAYLRTMGWDRVAEQEWENGSDELRAIYQAYADGVNAYLGENRGASISFEYAVLSLMNPDYEPEPWTPVHSMTWGKAMAWNLSGNMTSEIQRATLLPKIGSSRLSELYPPYPEDHPTIVPSITGFQAEASAVVRQQWKIPPTLIDSVRIKNELLESILMDRAPGIGSNNWVIGGDRTTSGFPLLADDMHLSAQMPSIWYEIGIHCRPVSENCRFNSVGYSFVTIPIVVVGHNDHIAWGVTNLGPDVQDLYLEKINPENPLQYQVEGEWWDMEVVEDIIRVAGSDPVPITIRYTRHGPILSDASPELQGLALRQSPEPDSPMAISLRWTALEPGTLLESGIQLNLATNWDEFRQALSMWDVPSQNFVFADREGNIGYQTPGRIPIRAKGDGSLPVPGWTNEYEWIDFIPYDELPRSFNPDQGYLATANNAVIGLEYPYLLSTEWDLGYRANRIVEMIESKGTLSRDDIRQIHGDNFNAMGPLFVPLLFELEISDPEIRAAVETLDGWNFQNHMDSQPAALFNAFFRHLILRTFADEIPAEWVPGGSYAFVIFENLVEEPTNPWWDDSRTPAIETMEDMMLLALQDAYDELLETLGGDPADWTWGALHTITFENETLGRSGITPIEWLFNRGPYRTSGGSSIVNATGASVNRGYEVGGVPSQRMIVDMEDFTNSLSIHTTGQSGHAFHKHYADMVDPWRFIEYHPMLWTREQVEADAEALLILQP